MLRSAGAKASELPGVSGAKACAECGSASAFPARSGTGCPFNAAGGNASPLAAVTTRRTGSAGSAAGTGALARAAGANCAMLDFSGANSSG